MEGPHPERQGHPAGYRAAFDKALKLKPDGIVAAAFDPKTASAQVKKAKKLGIPVIGWHAIPDPGPSRQPELFSNITSRVEDVASISADWIIARSKGRAGVVLFTDATAPFAKHKSDLIKKRLATCSDVKLLSYKNLPIPKANSRSTKEVRALLSRFGDKWTYSAAINDLYFGHAAPALRAAGKEGTSAPFNIGAGDGDPSAFERVNGKQFQAATVPEPLRAGLADRRRVQPRLHRPVSQWIRRSRPHFDRRQQRRRAVLGLRGLPSGLPRDLGRLTGSRRLTGNLAKAVHR